MRLLVRLSFCCLLAVVLLSGSCEGGKAACRPDQMATFKKQPTAVLVKRNKVKVSWRHGVKNRSCLTAVRVQTHECDRDGRSLPAKTLRDVKGKSALKMPVVSNNCYLFVVELFSDAGKVWSQPVRVET